MSDFQIIQGTDGGVAWPILNLDNTPFDLTGYTVRAKIKTLPGVLLVTFGSNLGNALIVGNQVILTWTSAETSNWNWNLGIYDIEIISSTGSVSRLSRGTAMLKKEVTD